MLKYVADDDDDWDGGFWGSDDSYDDETESRGCCYCCKSKCSCCLWSCFCTMICCGGLMVLFFMFVEPSQLLCDYNVISCNNSVTVVVANATQVVGGVNVTDGGWTGVNVTWNATGDWNATGEESIVPPNYQDGGGDDAISNVIINQDVVNKTFLNNTEYATNNYIINRDIKNGGIRGDEKVRQYDAGTAVAISISSVFVFVFCIIGTVYAVKHNKCNCKRYITNLTVSKGSSNTFSMDEVNQTGDGTINPILGVFQPKDCDCRIKEMYKDNANSFFVEGVVFIKKAIQKDNEHYYKEAIDLYNKGIDKLVIHMKKMANAGERFALAKKMDVYLKRVQYLNKIVANQQIIDN